MKKTLRNLRNICSQSFSAISHPIKTTGKPTNSFLLCFMTVFYGLSYGQTVNNCTPLPPVSIQLDANYEVEDPGDGGFGITWDFSDIPFNTPYTAVFALSESGLGSEHFPDATAVEIIDAGIGGNYKYYDFSESTWRVMGSYAVFGTTENIITYSDPHEYFTMPINPGSSGADSYTINTSLLGLPWNKEASCTWEVDGSGTLIMPNNTYADVLRVRIFCEEFESMGSSTPLRDNDITHHIWVKDGVPHPLLMTTYKFTLDLNNGETSEHYAATGLVSLDIESKTTEVTAPEFKLYPNPTSSYILAEIKGEMETVDHIRIVDIYGKEIQSKSQIIQPNVPARIDISGLTPGMYLLGLTGEKAQYFHPFIKL